MFDKKEYHKTYMREYRKANKQTPEQRANENAYRKEYRATQTESNPDWIGKVRERSRESIKMARENPEVRSKCYKDHTEWSRKNKDHVNAKQRARNECPNNKLKAKVSLLKKKYGLSYEDYLQKRANQNELCPICENEIGRGATDHDHSTGLVRDILCDSCNRWIGFIEKNRKLVKPMIRYLNKWDKAQSK